MRRFLQVPSCSKKNTCSEANSPGSVFQERTHMARFSMSWDTVHALRVLQTPSSGKGLTWSGFPVPYKGPSSAEESLGQVLQFLEEEGPILGSSGPQLQERTYSVTPCPRRQPTLKGFFRSQAQGKRLTWSGSPCPWRRSTL